MVDVFSPEIHRNVDGDGGRGVKKTLFGVNNIFGGVSVNDCLANPSVKSVHCHIYVTERNQNIRGCPLSIQPLGSY